MKFDYSKMDYRKLRGKIVEVFGTLDRFSAAMGLERSTVSLKMNGKLSFTPKDINRAVELLGLSFDDIQEYFFKVRG